MRYVAIRDEGDLGQVVARVYGGLKRNDSDEALRRLLRANPHLLDVNELLPGAVVVIPDIAGLRPDAAAEGIEAADRAARADALHDYLGEFDDGQRQRRAELQARKRTLGTKVAKAGFDQVPQGERGRKRLLELVEKQLEAEQEEAAESLRLLEGLVEHLG